MLLGAAKILKDKQDEIEGTVYLCFERSEEGASNAGVRYIFAYMEKNGIKPDTVYGMHLLSTLESGKLAINDTNMMEMCIRDRTNRVYYLVLRVQRP